MHPMLEESTIPVAEDRDIVMARQKGRLLAARLGFPATDQISIATAISELSRNIVEYAGAGEIHLSIVRHRADRREGIQVVARDEGPGIPDLDLALRDGFSTSRSLGLGLPGTRRLMDEFEIQSHAGRGTRITIRKWLKGRP